MQVNLEEPLSILDLKKPEYESLLKDLQGNILKSHGRDHTVHLFIRFGHQPPEEHNQPLPHGIQRAAKSWIQRFVNKITSAKQQLDDSAKYRHAQEKEKEFFAGRLFVNFLLSADGYRALGCTTQQLPHDWCFRQGLKDQGAQEKLGDPSVDTWEEDFRGRVDAMILLADDYVDRLYNEVEQIKKEVSSFSNVIHIDRGQILRNTKGQSIEHFGYVDGVSQPLFFQEEIDKAMQHDIGENKWNQGAPLSLVLVRDPHGSLGSYGVYRKLAQDVRLFRTYVKHYAEKERISKDLAEGRIIGRFKDGTPLASHYYKVSATDTANNFNYDDDANGLKCPFSAHIRKTNPRQDVTTKLGLDIEWVRERRIARRSIPYGTPYDEDTSSEDQRGLLFLCFQRNIAEQFEYIQTSWASDRSFVQPGAGLDAIIAQEFQPPGIQKPPQDVNRFVTMCGGEYFFAPSISGLKKLSFM